MVTMGSSAFPALDRALDAHFLHQPPHPLAVDGPPLVPT